MVESGTDPAVVTSRIVRETRDARDEKAREAAAPSIPPPAARPVPAAPSGTLAKQSALEQFLTGDALQPWTRREQLDKLTRAELNRRLKRNLKGVELSSVIAFANGDPAAKKPAKKNAKKAGKKR